MPEDFFLEYAPDIAVAHLDPWVVTLQGAADGPNHPVIQEDLPHDETIEDPTLGVELGQSYVPLFLESLNAQRVEGGA